MVSRVAAIAETLRGGADLSDEQGKLATASVAALRASGLWRMRLCQELGGLELPIVAQIRALSALAEEDASSAWCTMVVNNAVATLGATMPPAAVERIFADGVPACTIAASPGGIATPARGGFVLSGTWRLASCVHHTRWIHATALVERDPSRPLSLALPTEDVTLLASWDAIGLAGTGSNDFTLDNYFLPTALTGYEGRPYAQVRGRRRYDMPGFDQIESYEHLAFALGIGRRALRELTSVLVGTPSYLADREMVQEQLGRLVLKLQAAEALAYAVYEEIDAAGVGERLTRPRHDRFCPRALAVHATQIGLECVQVAFHRSGPAGLRRASVFGKLLRDMSVAAKHTVVDDAAYTAFAQHLLETNGPLGLGEPGGAKGAVL